MDKKTIALPVITGCPNSTERVTCQSDLGGAEAVDTANGNGMIFNNFFYKEGFFALSARFICL